MATIDETKRVIQADALGRRIVEADRSDGLSYDRNPERAVPPRIERARAGLGGRRSCPYQKVYPREVEFIFPVAGRGRPRKRRVPNVLSVKADDMAQEKWRTLSWR